MNLYVVLCQAFVFVLVLPLQFVSEVGATVDPVFAVEEASKSVEVKINRFCLCSRKIKNKAVKIFASIKKLFNIGKNNGNTSNISTSKNTSEKKRVFVNGPTPKPLAEFAEPTQVTKRRHPLKKKKRKRKTKGKKSKHKRRSTHHEQSTTDVAIHDTTEITAKDFEKATANRSHFHWNQGKSSSDSNENERKRKPVDIIVHIKMNE